MKKTVSLDALYALVGGDLKLVDTLILARVRDEIPLISDIVHHIIASGGKRIRPALTLISAQLCGYSGDRQIALAAAVEFIHTATLLHDDVVDESKLRRNMPTANEVFGNKASVLVGDFLLSQAFQFMVADGSLKVLRNVGDDFREGKITLPVILAYALGDAAEKDFWNKTLGDLQQNEDDLQKAILLLKKYDTIQKTIDMAKTYCKNARKSLHDFPDSPARSAMLDLVDFCASRAY